MRWPKLKKIPETKPRVRIDPDPNMAPGLWEWSCLDCDAGGKGQDQEIRVESYQHCLKEGHAVTGSAL